MMNKYLLTEMIIRRRGSIIVPKENSTTTNNTRYVAAILKDIEQLGYTFDKDLIDELQTLPLEEITQFYKDLVVVLRQLVGAHVIYEPMYPNFPQQVMSASNAELYINAIIHYISDGKLLPDYDKETRFPLIDNVNLRILKLASKDIEKEILINLINSKTSLSETDKEDLKYLLLNIKDSLKYLPDEIYLKENVALVCKILLENFKDSQDIIKKYMKTSVDILRFIVALSDGDVSLAENTYIRKLSRSERRFILSLLENINSIEEDMSKYKGPWIKIAERLHPGEYSNKYPKAYNAFRKLRNNIRIETFNSKLEEAFKNNDVKKIISLLKTRPGLFARNLDRILRCNNETDLVICEFARIASEVSTPILLQVREHFSNRNNKDLRIFFPKGNIAKVYSLENNLNPIDEMICNKIICICEFALMNIYSTREKLGKVYIDERLKNYIVPFSQRSASKSLKTIVRGSKIPVDNNIIRAFIYWKQPENERVDIDLSATLLDENLIKIDDISYWNLRDKKYKACHSGDITSAPNGASEFIDIDLESFKSNGGRYVVFSINSFTNNNFCDLPECFIGWMNRADVDSGEIFEPKTVVNKIDLSSKGTICIPIILDVVENKIIWSDLSLKQQPYFPNNVNTHANQMVITVKSILNINKPNLYDLFSLNTTFRGEIVDNKKNADTVFSIEEGITPFDSDIIINKFL